MPIPYQEHTVYRTIKDLGPHVSLVDQLDLSGIFFVCHDWGEPTGLLDIRRHTTIRLSLAHETAKSEGDRCHVNLGMGG